jgi:antirestriction protein
LLKFQLARAVKYIDILNGILAGNIALGKPREIKPFVAMQPFIVVQCVVEVESVYEKCCSPHSIRKPGATGLPGPPAHEVLTG